MSKALARDLLNDDVITPENAALLFIDYQHSEPAGPLDGSGLPLKNAVPTVQDDHDLRGSGRALDRQCRSGQGPVLPELAVRSIPAVEFPRGSYRSK